jgi:hypothetical protein
VLRLCVGMKVGGDEWIRHGGSMEELWVDSDEGVEM